MSIDSKKVKKFWDSQALKYGRLPLESLNNLEEDPALLKLKLKLEREKILNIINTLNINNNINVLDLGAGTGVWSMFLAPMCKKVYAVEYSERLTNLGKEETNKQVIENIEFINQPAQKFTTDIKFD